MLATAEFEDGIAGNSTWADGDWNGDGDFDSRDLILAFSSATYQDPPPQPAVDAAMLAAGHADWLDLPAPRSKRLRGRSN